MNNGRFTGISANGWLEKFITHKLWRRTKFALHQNFRYKMYYFPRKFQIFQISIFWHIEDWKKKTRGAWGSIFKVFRYSIIVPTNILISRSISDIWLIIHLYFSNMFPFDEKEVQFKKIITPLIINIFPWILGQNFPLMSIFQEKN